jgi:phage terminase small subunit
MAQQHSFTKYFEKQSTIVQFPPPEHLSPETRAFWVQVTEDYELTPDAAMILRTACENWDRAQQAREAVAQHGLLIEGRRNPACDIEKVAYGLFLRAMRQLGLDVIPPGSLPVGRPAGR